MHDGSGPRAQARGNTDVENVSGPYEQQDRGKYGFYTVRGVLAALVVAGLCGAFGRGPLAMATVTSPDGAVTVRYERFERFRTPASLQIDYGGSGGEGPLRVVVANAFLAGASVISTTPRSLGERATPDGTEYSFATAAGPAVRTIVFSLQPTRPWRIPAQITVNDRVLAVPILVYP